MIDRLRMWERGRAIERVVAFRREEEMSISMIAIKKIIIVFQKKMSSGLEAVFDGRLDMRNMIVTSVYRNDGSFLF